MYVDIGMDLAVRASQVLGVFDLDNTSWSKRTREFLQRAQEDGCLIEATDELPKSFVLTGIRADARLLDQIQRIHPCPALRRRQAAMIPRFLIKAKGEIHE